MEENSEAKVGVDNKKDKSENKPCNKLDDSSNKKENLWAVDTDDSFTLNIDLRGGSRAAATSKTEHFVIIVNGFYKALHRKCCSSVLDPPLDLETVEKNEIVITGDWTKKKTNKKTKKASGWSNKAYKTKKNYQDRKSVECS